jgi:hypothetical protein
MIKLDKEKIIKSYCGDIVWLEEVESQILENLNNNLNNLTNKEIMQLGKAKELIIILYKMNYIIVETETKEYFDKYNAQVLELYSTMKIDLMELLDYDNFWEEIN